MCQQWFSVIGLVLDVVGFLIIAMEWRHTFLHSVFLRQAQVEVDYERTRNPKMAAKLDEGDASMWRNTQNENRKDNRKRAQMFCIGVCWSSWGS
jgi:hypothetical protein